MLLEVVVCVAVFVVMFVSAYAFAVQKLSHEGVQVQVDALAAC